MTTPEQLFGDLRAADGTRPLVTFYDDSTGERAELSAASLANWTAKTYFLLTDEVGLGPGDRAVVRLPVHWLTVVALFGSWFAGLEVVSDPSEAAVAFVDDSTGSEVTGVPDVFAFELRPWGQGYPGAPPDGTSDFVAAVRPQPDTWGSVRAVAARTDPAWNGVSRADLISAAHARASELGLADGARLLVGQAHGIDVVTWLAPFTVAGSLVLIRNADPSIDDPRAVQERVTAVAEY